MPGGGRGDCWNVCECNEMEILGCWVLKFHWVWICGTCNQCVHLLKFYQKVMVNGEKKVKNPSPLKREFFIIGSWIYVIIHYSQMTTLHFFHYKPDDHASDLTDQTNLNEICQGRWRLLHQSALKYLQRGVVWYLPHCCLKGSYYALLQSLDFVLGVY